MTGLPNKGSRPGEAIVSGPTKNFVPAKIQNTCKNFGTGAPVLFVGLHIILSALIAGLKVMVKYKGY